VPHPTFNECQARDNNEFIERLTDNGTQSYLIALAPHGGEIEPRTDQQAEWVAAVLGTAVASAWRCKGYNANADPFATWHITSADIDERSFPGLAEVIFRGFNHAVSFHGFKRDEVLVGGAGPLALKQDIQAEIVAAVAGSGIPVHIAEDGDPFGGDEERNVVNRITSNGRNGIQIEQSLEARTNFWRPIADAVAKVYRDQLP
jgi:phage replication-related protein YjqB (UPF0714/DUF867 family)